LNLLFVTSEAFPLIKTGGLADVSGALPKALKNLAGFNGEIKILIPGYSEVLTKLNSLKSIASITVLNQSCDLIIGKLPNNEINNIEVIAIKNAGLYERSGGPYNDENGIDWPDNALRFAVLSRVASLLCSKKSLLRNWLPSIVHCNDWQTGLTPAYMKLIDNSSVKSLLSIHNLAFQGNFEESWLTRLELPQEHFKINGFEFFGKISFLKAGIYYADQLSTVSQTYAKEIQTELYGCGLQGLLQARKNDLSGILNGIDTQEWNPATDKYLPVHYSNQRITGKSRVKYLLQKQLGLKIDADAPLLGIVSRLTHQKGLDILPKIMPELIKKGCQFAILGSGDKVLEASFNALNRQYPENVSMYIGYQESLSHNIMAGSDMFIMPSRFEPCGLNQLYGLAYGTPPIVSATGGLTDSVCGVNSYTLKSKIATGFVIENVTSASLLGTIYLAIETWKDKKTWRSIQKNGMQKDVSWASSAILYLDLYKKMLRE